MEGKIKRESKCRLYLFLKFSVAVFRSLSSLFVYLLLWLCFHQLNYLSNCSSVYKLAFLLTLLCIHMFFYIVSMDLSFLVLSLFLFLFLSFSFSLSTSLSLRLSLFPLFTSLPHLSTSRCSLPPTRQMSPYLSPPLVRKEGNGQNILSHYYISVQYITEPSPPGYRQLLYV